MPLDADQLRIELEELLQASGFVVNHPYSRMNVLTQAIAVAVVNHIKANGKANITYGDSSGLHDII